MSLRLSLFVAAAVALSALTGCGVVDAATDAAKAVASSGEATPSPTPSPSPSEAREGRLLAAPEAKAALPTVDELTGTRWVAGQPNPSEPDPGISPADCARFFVETSTDAPAFKSKVATREAIQYTDESDGFTDVTFEIASWTQAADSTLPITAAGDIDACSAFTVTDADGTIGQFTAERLTPLPIGEKQVAFQLTVTVNGTTGYLSVFEASIGHNLITAYQTSLSPDDPQPTFEPLIKGMLADLA